MCWKMGLFWQGLFHDLSKYSPAELAIYKYYDGSVSPHQRCREAIGYSPSWRHHYHRNKHHWEFYLDNQDGIDFVAAKIPYKYVIEMFCDMVGASKAYLKEKYTPGAPYQYYLNKCKGKRLMHVDSETLLEKLLQKLQVCQDTKVFIDWYKSIKIELKQKYEKN